MKKRIYIYREKDAQSLAHRRCFMVIYRVSVVRIDTPFPVYIRGFDMGINWQNVIRAIAGFSKANVICFRRRR